MSDGCAGDGSGDPARADRARFHAAEPRCTAGLAREVAQLFREHGGLVERALRRAGVAERDLGDARQEVFIVVLRKLGGFEGRSSLSTWLYAISVHVASDFRRKAHRRREQLGGPRPDGCDPDALSALERRERLEQVLSLVEALPAQQRDVLVLHELFELSMGEVAARLGCPLKTAFSRLYAARRRLLSELRARGERTPFWAVLLPLRQRLDVGLRFELAASLPGASAYALGALVAACLVLPGSPAQREPLGQPAGSSSIGAAARLLPPQEQAPRSAPAPRWPQPSPAASPRLAPPPARPRLARAAFHATAVPVPRAPDAAPDDGLQVVRMGSAEVASGAEHPWAADVAEPRRTRRVHLRGPHDPADELERELTALP